MLQDRPGDAEIRSVRNEREVGFDTPSGREISGHLNLQGRKDRLNLGIHRQRVRVDGVVVGLAGREGDIFRKVFGWSLLLLLFMCLIVTLQGTPVLSWMVP